MKCAELEIHESFDRMMESFRNPRLENEEIDYLNAEHIDQLRKESEIIEWNEYADPVFVPGVGTLRRIGIRTKQGYTYDTLIGIPEKPQSEVPVIGTTAWTTSLRGHNEHFVRNLTRAGNYVIFVGAEGSYISDETSEPSSPITLASSAAAVLNFSYHMVEDLRQHGHVLDDEKRIVVGESRGGMVAEGIDALAEEFAQDIIFADQIAPCLPKKLESITEWLRLGEQVAKEPLEIAKLIGSLSLVRLKYYPHTLDIRWECLKDQLVIGGALFSGETGAMARKTPGNTLKHITVFDIDFASMKGEWTNIYGDNPNVRITPLPGGHMTIANLETLQYVIGRNKAVQEFLQQSKPLDGSIYDLSHKLAARQYPISVGSFNLLKKASHMTFKRPFGHAPVLQEAA